MYHNTPPPLPPRPGQQSPTIGPRSANNSFTQDGSSSSTAFPRTSRTCSLIDAPPSVPPKPSQSPNKGSPTSKPSNSDSPKLVRSPIRPSSLIVANTSIATPMPLSLPKPFSDKNNTYSPTPLVSQANSSIDFMPQNVSTSSQSRKATIYEYIDPTNPEKLSDIVTDSSVLPMRVAFCESVYGLCESFTFSSNELFDIHFLKESQFANILMSSRGSMLKIPLQVPIQFTLNYSPDFTCDAEYEVPQLMKLYNLPTVALVKDTGASSHSSRLKFRNNKSSKFVQGEMLIFKSRIKSSTIECFSLSQKETKRIHKSSELTLITNPSQSTFDFTDLIFFDVPLQVQIQAAPEKLKPRLRSASTIISLTKEKSLVTSFSDAKINDNDPTNIPLYEIFIDAPIEFQRVCTLPKEKENLLKKSKQIFDNFSPHHVKLVVPNSNDQNSQKEPLYDFLKIGGDYGNEQLWRKVTKLLRPSMFSEMSSPLCNMPEDQPEQIKEVLPTKQITETSKVEYDYVRSVEWSGSVVHEPYVPMISSRSSPKVSQKRIDPPSSNTSSPPVSIVHDSKAHQDILTTQTETDYVSGVHHLEDLSCDQVLDLLDKLGLSRYKDLFIQEKISGKLLQELDEEMLEQDLGITSRLHRLKLKRVIEGRESLDGIYT